MNTDHLGNVLTTVNDRKLFVHDLSVFEAVIETSQDYYPFGMLMPGRKYNPAEYRFGYNGKEKDDEVTGTTGVAYDYGFRIYDSRISRFLSVDPLKKKFPMLSSYQYASNSPIQNIDIDGLEGYKIVDDQTNTTTIVVDFHYVPKTKENHKVYNSGLTKEEVEKIRSGIMNEFNKSKFVDNSHVNEITGQAYDVNLQINLHSHELGTEAKSAVNSTINDPYNSSILVEKNKEKKISLPDGLIGIVKGSSVYAIIRVSPKDSHNQTEELFHNLIHNHQNASETNKKLIDPTNPEPGHKEAGGIFIYQNDVTGTKQEDLNQKNIDDALTTIPEKK